MIESRMFSFFKPKLPKKPSRDELLKNLQQNAAQARAEIGEETLDKIRQHLERKENSPFEQAKKQLMAFDRERLIDNIRAMKRGEID